MHQLLTIIAVLVLTLDTALPATAQEITFENNLAAGRFLEIYGLMAPAGELRLTYEVKKPGEVSIRVQGRRPGLQEADQWGFRRVACLVGDGDTYLTMARVESFYNQIILAITLLEDRYIHGTEGTAKRFGTSPEQVTKTINDYLEVFNKPCSPRPSPRGSSQQAV